MTSKTIRNAKFSLLAISMTALFVTFTSIPTADAATLCSGTGVDGSKRCYATSTYSPKSSPYEFHGFYDELTFDNKSPSNGFLQHSIWGIFSDGTVLESGINDPQNSGSAKFIVAVDGYIEEDDTGVSDDTTYNMEILDTNEDGYWTLYSDNTWHVENVGTSPTMYSVYVGSEAVYTNAPNFNIDHDDLDAYHDGSWVTPSSSTVWQGETKSSGYFVDECGSGGEPYYHLNNGKGSTPNC